MKLKDICLNNYNNNIMNSNIFNQSFLEIFYQEKELKEKINLHNSTIERQRHIIVELKQKILEKEEELFSIQKKIANVINQYERI